MSAGCDGTITEPHKFAKASFPDSVLDLEHLHHIGTCGHSREGRRSLPNPRGREQSHCELWCWSGRRQSQAAAFYVLGATQTLTGCSLLRIWREEERQDLPEVKVDGGAQRLRAGTTAREERACKGSHVRAQEEPSSILFCSRRRPKRSTVHPHGEKKLRRRALSLHYAFPHGCSDRGGTRAS